MKRIFKTVFLAIAMTGMLMTSVPVFALERAVNIADMDPNDLLTEDELPEGAEIRDGGEVADRVYEYDENGNLVPAEDIADDRNDEPGSTENEDATLVNTEVSEPEQEGPLTPDGNMNLIDDYGDKPTSGKQFITLETKSGAVFYLIIDRDDNGMETVHFLNKVDESDILAYMEDEEKAAFEERKNALEAQKAALIAEEEALKEQGTAAKTVAEETAESESEDTEKDKLKVNASSNVIALIVVVVGIAAIIYILIIKKKGRISAKSEPVMDPDDWDDDAVDSELADVPDAGEDAKDE
jgi:hypothetical protein